MPVTVPRCRDWSSDGLRQPHPTQFPADLGKSPPSLQVRGPPRFPERSWAAGTYLRPPASGRGSATACPPAVGTVWNKKKSPTLHTTSSASQDQKPTPAARGDGARTPQGGGWDGHLRTARPAESPIRVGSAPGF
ncbi:uncharacterized protein LOC112610655 [Theropithecus gelada]|uniref:uncharacterized protein LOC112610655 n=1 Tax=Theropithecus gelada TaxID=9565 RepID=UPI000DC177B5|nr:uncharacterized protein LOC112610655 [Theropithecus gelada]